MRPLTRVEPAAGPEAFKTYQISAPASTHFRAATCAEVECQKQANGFKAVIDVSTELGKSQADYIEQHAGRHYTRTVEGTIVTYTFRPGQDCFDQHKVSLEREPLFIVRGGDHRGNPMGIPSMRHARPEYWVEDFAEHQDRIADQQRRG